VTAPIIRILAVAGALVASGCGDLVRQGRSPVMLVIDRLEAASGAQQSAQFGGTLDSDVITIVEGNPTIFSDSGRVTMRILHKDPAAGPSGINAVTITRYRVTYRRSDGRNIPGVDVPQPFDSAVTFTVAPGVAVQHTFELVRHLAKEDAPLAALVVNLAVTIATVADITFFGRDQAGNAVSTTGSIGVIFGDFGDPD
jgi:hypothetical protein